jgi:hypothetical protein
MRVLIQSALSLGSTTHGADFRLEVDSLERERCLPSVSFAGV